MKSKVIASVIMLALIVSACGFWGVRGNGRVKRETRTVSDFERLEAGGAFTIKVKVGPAPSLTISAEGNLLSYIKTSVKGNRLVIDTRKSISPRKEIIIEVTTPVLNSVDASGANNISVYDISSSDFEADLSGAGHVYLAGTTDRLNADLSGAGNIEAKELKAKDVHVSVSGAASADVYATESLDASVSGVGSIDYYGDPKTTNTNVSGVGSISRK
jgi:hypothetical protein